MEAEKPEGYDHHKLTVDLMQEKKALLKENVQLREAVKDLLPIP